MAAQGGQRGRQRGRLRSGGTERPVLEREAKQPQFSDVPQSKQDPDSKQDPGSEQDPGSQEDPGSKQRSVPLGAGILQPSLMEHLFSAPDQYQLSTLEAVPPGEPPDPKTCANLDSPLKGEKQDLWSHVQISEASGSPRQYLEYYIFPVLLPGLAALLQEAEKEECLKVRRTKFIPSDFLTEWLYNKNPKKKDESFTKLFSIPFVKDCLKDHPRPPTPLSLILSEEEACLIIQSFWRGYRVRCDSEIQELRQWQKKLREERHITKIVKEFWAKQEAKVRSKSEELDKHTQNPSTSQFQSPR